VPAERRQTLVSRFNSEKTLARALLISTKAGESACFGGHYFFLTRLSVSCTDRLCSLRLLMHVIGKACTLPEEERNQGKACPHNEISSAPQARWAQLHPA